MRLAETWYFKSRVLRARTRWTNSETSINALINDADDRQTLRFLFARFSGSFALSQIC